MKRFLSIIMAAFLCFACISALVGCDTGDKGDETAAPVQTSFDVTGVDVVKVRITMNDGGVMDFELYPKIAPITVQNFVDLATSGFYDGLTFHRLQKSFVLQGGDPSGDGTGGSGKTIKGEFALNGVENNLSHTRGVISMARRGNDYDSATSQFFIVLSDGYTGSLDGGYAAFGKMIAGDEVLKKLEATEVNGQKPTTKIVIKTIRVID